MYEGRTRKQDWRARTQLRWRTRSHLAAVQRRKEERHWGHLNTLRSRSMHNIQWGGLCGSSWSPQQVKRACYSWKETILYCATNSEVSLVSRNYPQKASHIGFLSQELRMTKVYRHMMKASVMMEYSLYNPIFKRWNDARCQLVREIALAQLWQR
jgi:hypothetical protein